MSFRLTTTLLGAACLLLGAAMLWAADENASAETETAAAQPASDDQPKEDELPQFDQAAILSQQLERLDDVKEKLQLVMYSGESDHFLLFSDLDSRVRRAILIWLEDLRSKLISQLGVDPGVRLWDGKCMVVVFAKQESLAAYAATFDNHQTKWPRGYFVLEARRSKDPRLVHIAAYQPDAGGNEALREVLVHETTHAIIELYQKSAPLPLWVHEGLAEYMTVLIDPTLRPRKQNEAFRLATAEPYQSVRDVFTRNFSAADTAAYSVSMSLIECLYAIDPHGVLAFVELLKQGVEPEEALGQAYPGLNYDELERRWRRFCMKAYRPAADDDN